MNESRRAGDRAVVDQRGPLAVPRLHVPVERVPAGVEPAAGEPAVVRRVRARRAPSSGGASQSIADSLLAPEPGRILETARGRSRRTPLTTCALLMRLGLQHHHESVACQRMTGALRRAASPERRMERQSDASPPSAPTTTSEGRAKRRPSIEHRDGVLGSTPKRSGREGEAWPRRGTSRGHRARAAAPPNARVIRRWNGADQAPEAEAAATRGARNERRAWSGRTTAPPAARRPRRSRGRGCRAR